MGMDVYGKAHTAPDGEYFRNNIWWWRPLADYCMDVAPNITNGCKYWHSNDGDGLDADAAIALADALDAEIDSGRTLAFASKRLAENKALPDESCTICDGTGMRLHPPNAGAGDQPCNGCKATGRVRPSETMYSFSVKNVAEFSAFLRSCGGFRIC